MAPLCIQLLKLYFKVNPPIFEPVGWVKKKLPKGSFYEQDIGIVF
jgi:hypothetical protein